MISKKEWDALYREQLADGRKRIGPPPAFEEVEALAAGRLSETEADRIRDLLSYYPDLLHVFTESLPDSGEGVLTDAELAADWARIRERVRRRSETVTEMPEKKGEWRVFAIAAVVVIAVALGGVGLWRLSQPRSWRTVVAYADASRGGNPRGIPDVSPLRLSKEADYIVKPVFEPPRPYREYRLELLDLASEPPRRVWIRDHVAQQPDATYPIHLSTRELEPGLYRLVLYGTNDTVERLAEYTLRLKD